MIACICCSATSGFVLNVSISTSLPWRCQNVQERVAARYHPCVRTAIGVLAVIVTAVPCAALADPAPRFETTGFFGAEYFPSDTGLGSSRLPEQRPQTSALFGARLSYFALPSLAHGERVRLELGFEGELALATAWTGYGFADRRMSYFSPVFDWRGEVI